MSKPTSDILTDTELKNAKRYGEGVLGDKGRNLEDDDLFKHMSAVVDARPFPPRDGGTACGFLAVGDEVERILDLLPPISQCKDLESRDLIDMACAGAEHAALLMVFRVFGIKGTPADFECMVEEMALRGRVLKPDEVLELLGEAAPGADPAAGPPKGRGFRD